MDKGQKKFGDETPMCMAHFECHVVPSWTHSSYVEPSWWLISKVDIHLSLWASRSKSYTT